MVDNTERLSQIMQRMQVSNQRTLGNRFGGGYSGVSSATAPTPPSEQIDFSRNTLSPPSMAEPDDTGPGQQMPSVIQPPASGNVGMPSGGNAYSGNQPGVSPSTRDLYSLPDYSGGMRGGMGGDDRLDRLLKMLSSYMGSQMAPPSAAPGPVEAAPPSIDQPEPQKPVEYTGGSQLPAMPVNEYQPGYTPSAIPKGLKQSNSALTVMEDYYNAQTGERYSGGIGMAEPGSGWSTRGQPGYVARDYSGQPTPDLVRLGGSRVGPSTPAAPPPAPSPSLNMQSVGSNYLDFGMTNDPAEQARRQAQQRMDFQAANPGQSMDNALKGLTPGGLTPDMQISTGEVRYTPEQIAEAEAGFASGRIKKLNIPSLSSLDGRSPQAMPTKPATMGDEFKTLRLASGERENKFNALSEQEKASILRNLKISTYGR